MDRSGIWAKGDLGAKAAALPLLHCNFERLLFIPSSSVLPFVLKPSEAPAERGTRHVT